MALEQLISKIDVTRSLIESKLDGPGIVHVVSARATDGASALATILAYSFARSGVSTLLVETGAKSSLDQNVAPIRDADVLTKIRGTKQGAPDSLAIDDLASRSILEMKGIYSAIRARYGVTIVSNSLADDAGMLGFASIANAVLISVRKDRAACEEDRQLSGILRGAHAPLLGVVTVDGESMKTVSELPKAVSSLVVRAEDHATRNHPVSLKVG